MEWLGSLIGAGANLLGGLFNRQSSQDIAAQNIANQRLFAQNAIQWRVADARAAGINPLAALGAQTSSFSNVVGDTGLGNSIGAAGQDIGRAVNAMSPDAAKMKQLEMRLAELKVQNAEQDIVHNQLLNSKLARDLASPGSGPGVTVRGVPLPRPSPFTVNTLPLTQDYRGSHGERITLPSAEASQALQNLASTPGGMVVAAELLRRNSVNAGDAMSISATGIGRALAKQFYGMFPNIPSDGWYNESP